MVLVIDALDECDDEDDTELIIQLLSQSNTLTPVRLRVFITSRPETPIRYCFGTIGKSYRDFILHEIPNSIVDVDITDFSHNKFDTIRKRHHYLPTEWPDKPIRDRLVQKADGLFIYAATVCRFIGHVDCHPPERLTFVLEGSMEDGSPTIQLDLMYTKLLQTP